MNRDQKASMNETGMGNDKTAGPIQPVERFAIVGARVHAGICGPVLRQSQGGGRFASGGRTRPAPRITSSGEASQLLQRRGPHRFSIRRGRAPAWVRPLAVGSIVMRRGRPRASQRPEYDYSWQPLKAHRLSVREENGSVTCRRSPSLSPARGTDGSSCGQEREQLSACSGEAGFALLVGSAYPRRDGPQPYVVRGKR
ncbi:hypothetical protein GGX14DRAFT_388156 [Mycena pura]|uniref:Uncharacterized protein n=1 Tax=Mycena pura TaxID=153505 RepID=A0AAD7E030_9AGAR|nr:hypothetical protein GGX14DRAFT_388156 [Mycena pura]